jgi:hypothetical protein
MMATDPLAWRECEDALHHWLVQSTTIDAARVRTPRNRDSGEAKGPDPRATISNPSIVPLSLPSSKLLDAIMIQRYTVTAVGPGEVGIDFYPADSLDPQRISIVAAEDDTPAESAAALLLELQSVLPDGYTAAAATATAIDVTGSEEQPEFAAKPADAAMLTVATRMPRHPKLWYQSHRIVWRVEFSGPSVSAADSQDVDSNVGSSLAANAMASAQLMRVELLDGPMRRLGLTAQGYPTSQPSIPNDRSRSRAVLDVAFRGLFTSATKTITARAIGVSTSIAA